MGLSMQGLESLLSRYYILCVGYYRLYPAIPFITGLPSVIPILDSLFVDWGRQCFRIMSRGFIDRSRPPLLTLGGIIMTMFPILYGGFADWSRPPPLTFGQDHNDHVPDVFGRFWPTEANNISDNCHVDFATAVASSLTIGRVHSYYFSDICRVEFATAVASSLTIDRVYSYDFSDNCREVLSTKADRLPATIDRLNPGFRRDSQVPLTC